MKVQVPQYIDIEDRIIGPLTLRQFLFLVSVPGVIYIAQFFLKMGYLIIVAVVFVPLTILLAFAKVQGRPFRMFLGDMFTFSLKPQIYIWRREARPMPATFQIKKAIGQRIAPRHDLTQRGIKELAWRLDVGSGDHGQDIAAVKSDKPPVPTSTTAKIP